MMILSVGLADLEMMEREKSSGFFFQIFAKRNGDLIGAGGVFHAAMNIGQTGDSLINRHADEQSGNALRIAGAAAREGDIADDILLDVDVNVARANAARSVRNVFHDRFLSVSV
jgi:hypothetical protein